MHRTTATAQAPQPPHTCRRGWLGVDSERRPIPCPTCKPHLTRAPLALATVDGEAVMRRDRDGSETVAEVVHYCLDGWIGTDLEGRPQPCLTCRPHLARRREVESLDDWDAIR